MRLYINSYVLLCSIFNKFILDTRSLIDDEILLIALLNIIDIFSGLLTVNVSIVILVFFIKSLNSLHNPFELKLSYVSVNCCL
jgi:hypothetical protein